MPVSGRGTKWIQSHPTPRNLKKTTFRPSEIAKFVAVIKALNNDAAGKLKRKLKHI
jgi:hypothetical protein